MTQARRCRVKLAYSVSLALAASRFYLRCTQSRVSTSQIIWPDSWKVTIPDIARLTEKEKIK